MRKQPPMPDVPPFCLSCGIEEGLRRFSLVASVMVNQRHTTRGAGGIWLCLRCWKSQAQPRQMLRLPLPRKEVARAA